MHESTIEAKTATIMQTRRNTSRLKWQREERRHEQFDSKLTPKFFLRVPPGACRGELESLRSLVFLPCRIEVDTPVFVAAGQKIVVETEAPGDVRIAGVSF